MKRLKYTEEDIREAAKNGMSISDICRSVGIKPIGGNFNTIANKLKQYDIDTSHFSGQGWNVGLKFIPKEAAPIKSLLTEESLYSCSKLRKRLLKEGYKDSICENCGCTDWMGVPISLELHHLNGIRTDNRLNNLQLLCPNCHALTENYRGKNKKYTTLIK